MKKIAFFVRLFQINNFYAGGEKFLYKTIREFVSNGYTIDVWCYETNLANAQGINEIILCKKPENEQDFVSIENNYYEINNLMRLKGYDFVISDIITPYADAILSQIHSFSYLRYNKYNLFQNIYYNNINPHKINRMLYEQKWLKLNNKIFVVSEVLKNDLIKNLHINKDKISVIYPGVDFSEEININNAKKFDFGISATFFKRKGGLIFLWALIIAKLKGYDFKAAMILKNTSKQRWLKLLLKIFGIDENIEFLPRQSNMADFYSQIDCLVMPSIEESFGLVALEAMLNKIPVIVSSCSGISEIIEDGKDGFVFDIRNMVFSLANKMIYLANNREIAQNCILNGYNKAKKYNWSKTFNEMEKLLQ